MTKARRFAGVILASDRCIAACYMAANVQRACARHFMYYCERRGGLVSVSLVPAPFRVTGVFMGLLYDRSAPRAFQGRRAASPCAETRTRDSTRACRRAERGEGACGTIKKYPPSENKSNRPCDRRSLNAR